MNSHQFSQKPLRHFSNVCVCVCVYIQNRSPAETQEFLKQNLRIFSENGHKLTLTVTHSLKMNRIK